MSTRTPHRILVQLALGLLLASPCVAQPGYIRLQGDQFFDENGAPFFPMVMNYYVDAFYQGTLGSFPVAPNSTEIMALDRGRSSLWSCDGQFNYTFGDGLDEMLQDFQEMKAEGFNTVRMLSFCDKQPIGDGFRLKVKQHGTGQGDVFMDLLPPYVPDIAVNPVVWFQFETIRLVCEKANTLDMKVIIEPVMDPRLVDTQAGSDLNLDHCAYLSALASFIAEHQITNLLAYEFYGEPTGTDLTDGTWHSKADICELANTWISAVKAEDPDHMVTIGSMWHDDLRAQGWDPMLLAIDFASVHVYPGPLLYEWQDDPATFLQKATERYMNMFRQYDRYLRKPYIVMETGFSGENSHNPLDACHPDANPNIAYPISCWGSETDQDDFLKATFPPIRDSRCAGYGWWIFTNLYWSPWPDDVNVVTWGLAGLEGRFYSLLRHGDPEDAPGTTGWEGSRKAAANTLVDWQTNPAPYTPLDPIPASVDMDDRYFNPYMHPENNTTYDDFNTEENPDQYGSLTGRVVDEDGTPIAGAMIWGYSWSHWAENEDQDLEQQMYAYYTYSDNDGWFELRAYDPQPGLGDLLGNQGDLTGSKDRTVEDMKIGAYGCEWRQVVPPFVQNATYTVHSLQPRFDALVHDIAIPDGTMASYNALASLTTQDVQVEGNADFFARYTVQLGQEFHATTSSEMHAFTTPVFLDCEEVAAADIRSMSAPQANTALGHNPVREVEITFHPVSANFHVDAFPNPTTGRVSVWLHRDPQSPTPAILSVTAADGRIITRESMNKDRADLDLSNEAKGTYTLTLSAGEQVATQKILLQ